MIFKRFLIINLFSNKNQFNTKNSINRKNQVIKIRNNNLKSFKNMILILKLNVLSKIFLFMKQNLRKNKTFKLNQMIKLKVVNFLHKNY